jgi:signal transduction histidine kinase
MAMREQAPLRRTGWRLAALSVGLVGVLLLVLGVVVYVTMQSALMATMRSTLRSHATSEIALLREELAQPRVHLGSQQDSTGTFSVVANAALAIVNADEGSPFGQTLPDRAAAQQAVRSQRASFSTRTGSAGQQCLLYSLPVLRGGRVQGVVQTGLVEGPYLASLRTLLHVLLLVSLLGLVAATGISVILAQRALRPIRASVRRQRDFVADAAHELRTPLTILRSAAELGLVSIADRGGTTDLTADEQAAFEQTLQQSTHLARLVDDLALLARVDSGAVQVVQEPVEMAGLVRDLMPGVELLAEDREVQLQVAVLAGSSVRGDAGRLRQLLLILLDNALKHTPIGGTITLNIERRGHRLRLQVQDTGPGIAPGDLPHIFDRFYRADRARISQGSGLGLAIARWIVEAHRGHISAANAPSGGAIFTVTLPLIAGSASS